MDICNICGAEFDNESDNQSKRSRDLKVHSNCLRAYYDFKENPTGTWYKTEEAKLIAQVFNEEKQHEHISKIISAFQSGEIKWTPPSK